MRHQDGGGAHEEVGYFFYVLSPISSQAKETPFYFYGATITSDAGLIAYRELDCALGLAGIAE